MFFMGNFTVKICLKFQANNTKGLRNCANVKDTKNVNYWFNVGINVILKNLAILKP